MGYIRVSTDTQAEQGYSLENQQRAIKEYCRSQGINLLRLFIDEGKSATTTNRPEFKEMFSEIKEKGIDCVTIYKVDRFARNLGDFGRIRKEFKKAEIKLLSVIEGDVSEGIVGNLFALIAEWESDVNGQRTRDALMQKFRNGWQPTPSPVGYRSVGGEHEQKSCEIDPYAGPIIKQLFELYSSGEESMVSLQEWLKDKNIISKNGTIISFSRINNILNNPFYYGLIRWHGQEKMGKHTPLITKQLFDMCKYVLEKHRHFLLRERKYDFLLRGFVFCPCGMRLVGDACTVRSNHKKIYYYHCQKRYSPDCKQKYSRAKDVEEQVEEYLKKLEFDEDFINQLKQKAQEYLKDGKRDENSDRQSIVNQKTGIEIKRNKLEDLLLDGTLDKDTYKRKHSELTQEIDNLTTLIEEKDNEKSLDLPFIDEALSLTRNIYTTYKRASDPVKRHFLRFFFERFVVEDKKIIEAKHTPIFDALFCANMVRLSEPVLPNPGFEPGTYRLHVILNFRCGVDYLITLSLLKT